MGHSRSRSLRSQLARRTASARFIALRLAIFEWRDRSQVDFPASSLNQLARLVSGQMDRRTSPSYLIPRRWPSEVGTAVVRTDGIIVC